MSNIQSFIRRSRELEKACEALEMRIKIHPESDAYESSALTAIEKILEEK